MLLAEVASHVGRFCEVVTHHGVFYGEIVRLAGAVFLVRPKLLPALPPREIRADDVTRIRALPDPRH